MVAHDELIENRTCDELHLGQRAQIRRTLRASDRPDAREAITLFTHRVRREFGAMLAVLRGVDLIAFTGGIGAQVRCASGVPMEIHLRLDPAQVCGMPTPSRHRSVMHAIDTRLEMAGCRRW